MNFVCHLQHTANNGDDDNDDYNDNDEIATTLFHSLTLKILTWTNENQFIP